VTRHDAYRVTSDTVKERSAYSAELRITDLQTEVDSLRRQLADRDSRIVTIEELSQHLKKQLSSHVAEISVSSINFLVFVLLMAHL